MATFDELIQEIESRYSLGPKASPLVHEILGLISGQLGGMGGFLDRFKAAGFATEVASWSGGTEVVPLSGEEVERTLGSEVISETAKKADISQSFARTIMGDAIPKVIVLLARGEAVPSSNSCFRIECPRLGHPAFVVARQGNTAAWSSANSTEQNGTLCRRSAKGAIAFQKALRLWFARGPGSLSFWFRLGGGVVFFHWSIAVLRD